MPFVFYDTETTGTEAAFDQVLQFAAIRTDDLFNELERFEIRCRIASHIVPSPGALAVNRIGADRLSDPTLASWYRANCAIHAKLRAWSPAVFIGYNSISFDEGFLRQGFYQNLLPTYLTNTGGNSRADVLTMAQAAMLAAPGTLFIPTDDKGNARLKLDMVAPANGFNSHNAHDALGDVEATIHIARLLRSGAPALWQAMMQLCRKASVISFVSSHPVFLLGQANGASGSLKPVTRIGPRADYDSEIAVFDLRSDPEPVLDLDESELVKVLTKRNSPIRTVRANAQPIALPLGLAPAAIGLEEHALAARADTVQKNDGFRERVGRAMVARYADRPESSHIENRIYAGFASPADETRMRQFHVAPWQQRHSIAQAIEDERHREFGLRIIHAEMPDTLPPGERVRLDSWRRARIDGSMPDVEWLTKSAALAQLADTDDSLRSWLSAL
jgi:exodeoxyribonuclease I